MMPTAIHAFSGGEIMAYLDGELSPERALAAAQHLEDCPECQRLVEDFQSLSASLLDWQIEPSPSLPPSLPAATSGRPQPVRWDRPWLLLASAAGFTLPDRGHSRTLQPLRQAEASHSSIRDKWPHCAASICPNRFGRRDRRNRRAAALCSRASLCSAPPAGPLIIRTAQLALTSKNFDSSRAALEPIVKLHQGYLAQLEFNTPASASRSLNATLRVPAAQLDPRSRS